MNRDRTVKFLCYDGKVSVIASKTTDLVEYVKEHGNLDGTPFGLHSVVHENKSLGVEKGVIYILKNINNEVNIDSMNQLHPFYF